MDGYLIDTSALSALLDPLKPNHQLAQNTIESLESEAPKYVSAIALAELEFGCRLAEIFEHNSPERFADIIQRARSYPLLAITKHTSTYYAQLKAGLAQTYLQKALKRPKKPRWLEDWVDKATGKMLQIDENDLWMAAQASERNLVLVTGDAKMTRIQDANPQDIRIRVI